MQMCNDIYNVYDKEKFDYYYPYTFHNKDLDYLNPDDINNITKVQIPLGDTKEIEINLDEKYSEQLQNKQLIISIYNFRYELIHQLKTEPTLDLILNVDINMVENCFKTRGIYYCQINLTDEINNSTIILPYNYVIEII